MPEQDWRAALKRRLSRAAHGDRRRPMVQAAYGGLIAAETAVASAWAGRRRRGPVDPGTVTLVVKTFERPEVLGRMLASVRRVFAGPVVVADDSRTPWASDDPRTTVLTLPFDSGIGAGRNAVLAAVDTPYVFMTDDDMVLLPDFDVTRALAYLERNPQVDVVGGRVVHLPLWRTADYSAAALYARRGEPLVREGTLIDGLPVAYKVPNFYVARTESVRAVGYDDRLKRVDHNDFFTAAHGRLVCVVDPAMVCLHAHSYFDAHYQGFRMDTAADLALLATKWGSDADDRLPTASGSLADADRAAFAHAAVEVVARDLGVTLVHGQPGHVAASGETGPLVGVLRTLGWTVTRGHLSHGLWGDLALTTSPDALATARPGSLAGIDGLVGEASDWPASTGPRPDAPATGGVRWSPRAGVVDGDEALLAAPLPAGPVITLTPPGDVIFAAAGPGGLSEDELVAHVLAGFDDPPPDADAQVRAFVETLVHQGLLERCPPR